MNQVTCKGYNSMSIKLLILFLNVCYVLGIYCTNKQLECSEVQEYNDFESLLNLTQLIGVYYRYHGLRYVVVIGCKEDMIAGPTRQYWLRLVREFIRVGFYVRIYNGRDYLDLRTLINRRTPFDPPFTFRIDNDTRLPLHLQIQHMVRKTGVLMLNMNNSCTLNALRWSAATENNFFSTNNFWILLSKNYTNDLALMADEEIFLPPDSEVRVIYSNTDSSDLMSFPYNIIDVYKAASDKPLRQQPVGLQINTIDDLLCALNDFGYAKTYRGNLEGINLNTGLVIAFPDLFTNINDVSLRHIDTISKVNNHLTLELANKLNIRFNKHQTDNYGWHQENGSFDGLMGRFQRYELDFAQNAVFMRQDRLAVCDFIAETYRIRAGIMFRQPPLSAVTNIFAMPFNKDVWFSMLGLIFVIVFVITLELMYSPFFLPMDYSDCFLFVWGALCQQGFHVVMHNRSVRIITFTTFVATLFLFTSYSANIVALLQSPSTAIQTLADLASSPLEIGVQDTVYNKIYFNESTDPVTNHLYHRKIAPKGDRVFMKPKDGIDKLRTGLFAYQVELQAGYQIISETFQEPEKCGLMELEPFQLPMIAIPTRKNFPYKELFRRQLRWQREIGLMSREELKWFPQRPKCESRLGGFVSIGLTECRYALAVFAMGISLAFSLFILEHLTRQLWIIYEKKYLNNS